MTTRVTLIASGLSNLDSAQRAFEYCGADTIVTSEPSVIAQADRLVLPGVGAFPSAMRKLSELGVINAVQSVAMNSRRPVLGICLGMQLLAELGTEMEQCPGLGLIAGDILPLKSTKTDERVPHIGWNTVTDHAGCALLQGLPEASDFYFVHSFHFKARHEQNVQALTPSYGGFASIVGGDNIYGVQFHPEKSQAAGFQLLKNFLRV